MIAGGMIAFAALLFIIGLVTLLSGNKRTSSKVSTIAGLFLFAGLVLFMISGGNGIFNKIADIASVIVLVAVILLSFRIARSKKV